MSLQSFLLNLVLPTAEAAEETALDPVLQDLHDSNGDDYKAAINGAHALFQHLAPVLAKSNSAILKGLVGALEDEVNTNAAKNGITFTD